ncbi:MAG: TylF/MycF/NovP-related O-methyltransferase [Bdellovibrionota bacterium]
MKQSLEELLYHSQDHPLVSNEIHQPNEWYGHAHELKKYAGFGNDYQIKAVVEHGPTHDGNVEPFEIIPELPAIFINGSYRVPPIKAATNKAIFMTGSNMHYTEHFLSPEELEVERNRLGKTLLSIPMHSTHHINAIFNVEEYCQDLAELGKNFSSVQVCLFWKDIANGWHEIFQKYGFEVVTAGHMYDQKFLSRLKSIMDPASLITVNHVGTQVGYAVELGKPVYYLGNQKIENVLANTGDPNAYVPYSAHKTPAKLEIKKEISELTDEITPSLQKIVEKYWGLEHVKTKAELKEIFEITEDMYSRSPAFFMKSPWIVEEQIVTYLNNGDNNKALCLVDELSLQNPNADNPLYVKAIAQSRLGQTREAAQTLKDLLAQAPHLTKAKLLYEEIVPATPTKIIESQTGVTTSQIFASLLGEPTNNTQRSVPTPTAEAILHLNDEVEAEVNNLISQALDQLKLGKAEDAFASIIEAKKFHYPVRDLDHVRAMCFIGMDKQNPLGNARECLREELRHFPDNQAAAELLEQVLAEEGGVIPQVVQDSEFNNLLAQIKPYTMLPDIRLYSLYSLAKQVCEMNIPGNFVECGVAGGGSCALLAAVIKKYSKMPRIVFAFDSYEGMPEPGENDTFYGIRAEETGWGTGTCAAPEESVLDISKKMGVADIVKPIKGYFEDSLPKSLSEVESIAFIHIDCDWYDSANTVLDYLYDLIVPGAPIQLDDYGQWDGIKKALHEFEQKKSLSFVIQNIDNCSAWLAKPVV